MSDGTRKNIKMPSWHLPYLEKHNIYKLFSEIARELVIKQPEDHVFFIKYLLANAVENIHVPKVILIASPKVNVLEIAKQIAEITKQIIVTEADVLSIMGKKFRDYKLKTKDFIQALQIYINTNCSELKTGWILVDCIQTKEDALKLLEVGIMPSHVLYLISPYKPILTDLLYCHVTENWPTHRRNLFAIRDIFKKKLNEIYLHDFLIEDIVTKCVELLKIERTQEGPKQPRVVLLGPRGSGRKTQGKLLESKFGIVHVDFQYILCQTWKADNELGNALRKAADKVCFRSDLLVKVLNQRLLDYECLTKGWVLTGFPFNSKDFKYLDCLETPPNRVIFLECDLNICFERLVNRRVNIHTGSVLNLNEQNYDDISAEFFKVHPKDQNAIVQAELQYYCTQYGSMRKYCGGTASAVNAEQPERWVHESITALIVRDIPASSPRDPFEGGDIPVTYDPAPYKHFTHD